MGYTHYWEQKKNFSLKDWDLLKNAARIVVDHCETLEIPLIGYEDTDCGVIINDDMIRFNGVGDDQHETFILHRKQPERQAWMMSEYPFAFCKTARKPYDLAVCLVLLAAYMIAPDVLNISSDGDWEGDWDQAKQDYEELFDQDVVCPFPYFEPREDVATFHRFIDEKQ